MLSSFLAISHYLSAIIILKFSIIGAKKLQAKKLEKRYFQIFIAGVSTKIIIPLH
jgi:hypothetical protein